jgi:AcrR family transcriptional regulator
VNRARARRPRAPRGSGERLQGEILAAATRLLGATGDEDAVSIRAVADAVGVTPPAIYLHFADKDALIYAVCAQVFDMLDAVLEAADATTDDPVEALRGRGRAYVRFGLEHPEHYRVLFMSKRSRSAKHADALAPGMVAFQHLVDAVQRAMDAGGIAPGHANLVATGIWTTLHGVTSLLISMPDFPWPDVGVLVDHVCTTVLRGLDAPATGTGIPDRRREPRERHS